MYGNILLGFRDAINEAMQARRYSSEPYKSKDKHTIFEHRNASTFET